MTWSSISAANEARRLEEQEPLVETGFEEPDAAVAPASERAKAAKDAELFGIGFLLDAHRIEPSRVTVFRGAHFPHVTTSELWKALEDVLRDKGATDAWIEYALPDLQVAATQYAGGQWAKGHEHASAGNPMPNPQPRDEFTPGVEPMPNAETQAAMLDIRDGNGERFETVDALMTSLEDDAGPQMPNVMSSHYLDLPVAYRWHGEGPPPAHWTAEDGTIVYRSYADYCGD